MVIDVFAKSKSEVEADCRIWAEEIGKEYSFGLVVKKSILSQILL